MTGIIFAFLLVLDAVIVILVMRSLRLRSPLLELVHQSPQQYYRVLAFLKAVFAFPPVIAVTVFILIFVFWRTLLLARLSHLVLVLGLWMAASLHGVSLLAALLQNRDTSSSALIGLVLSVVPAIYFTPLVHFMDFFPLRVYFLPLTVGGFLILFSYYELYHLYALLQEFAPEKPLTLR